MMLRGSYTGDACPYGRQTVAELNFRHPRDLSSMEIRQKSRDVESVSREAHQRQGCRIYDAPSGGLQRFSQHVADTRLTFDHRRVTGFALLREREEQFQARESPGPLYRGHVRVSGRPSCFGGHE